MSFRPSRTSRHAASRVFASACLAFALLLVTADPAHATINVSLQLLLGNPSGATADTNNHSHFLIQRTIEALDYNDTLRQPNWASWCYTTNDSGSASRSSSFFSDPNLPPNFYHVLPTDLSGSGYDRGHMCPSADRTDTDANNDATFYMSNIIPQAPDNNQGVWANLENYARAIAASNEVLNLCGPQGFGTNRTDSAGQFPIASNVWKIIVAVPLGSGPTLSRITESTRVIAVNIPNIQGVRNDPWPAYLTSVYQLQTNTGFTFFTALDPSLAAILRSKVDGSPAGGITNLAPGSGTGGDSVVLRGTNFIGVTTVTFNGAPATFTVNSANQITATVPASATTGPVTVLTAGGLATSAVFTVNVPSVNPPTLTLRWLEQSLVLTWPTNAANYVLQASSELASGNWSNCPVPVLLTPTNCTTTVTNPAAAQFFRLLRP